MATILVVEGRAVDRAVLVARLAGAGHRVLEASNVAEALTSAGAESPDLVLAALPAISDRSELIAGLHAEAASAATPVLLFPEPDALLRSLGHLLGSAGCSVAAEPGSDTPALTPVSPGGEPPERTPVSRPLQALIELGRPLASPGDFRTLLGQYCRVARDLVDAECAVLGVLDDAGTAFSHLLTSGCAAVGIAGVDDCGSLITPGGPLGRLLPEGFPRREPAVGEVQAGGVSARHSPSEPVLGIPLDRAGRRYGVLGFAAKRNAERFSVEDELLAAALAAQIALACENAHQGEELARLSSAFEAAAAEHRRIETTLQESEQFRQVAEKTHDIFWLFDIESGQTLYLSPAFEEIWGQSCASLCGDELSWTQSVHPEDKPRILEAVRNGLKRGEYQEEYRIIRPDGTERWIFGRTFLVRSAPGKVARVGGIAEDITERKHAATALARYADRLASLREMDRAILEASHPRDVAQAAVRHLRRLVPCGHVNIWLFDFDEAMAEVLTSEGDAAERFPAGTRISLEAYGLSDLDALRRGEDHQVHDVLGPSASPEIVQSLLSSGLRSYFRTPLAFQGQLIGAMSLTWNRPGTMLADELEIVHEMADQLAVAIRHTLLFDEVRSGRERLQTLSRQLLKVQEEERRHMARELHDEIGQSLTVAKINLQHAMARDDKSSGLPYLEETSNLIDRILSQVRDLSLDLRPSVLDDLGLVAALRWYLDRLSQRAGFTGRLVAEPSEVRVAPDVETACFRVAQEALTNVARHARARHVHIDVRKRAAGLELLIRDDGAGFDASTARRRAEQGASLGLLGMQERVELLGGRMEIESRPGQGTEIKAWLPLAAPGESADSERGEDLP